MRRLLLVLAFFAVSATSFARPLPDKKFNPVWYFETTEHVITVEDEHHICSHTITRVYGVDWLNQVTLVSTSTTTDHCDYY